MRCRWKVFLGLAAGVVLGAVARADEPGRPNVLFLLADQWRAQATGYGGDPNVKAPNLDQLESQSVNFTRAVSACPVCCPFRASLLTGQRPLTHGVFLNDVPLRPDAVTIAKVLTAAGYDTGYIGKWHLNGDGRSAYIPPERRQGFQYWKALECTHEYNDSFYYADGPQRLKWEGYDAIAQTADAVSYLRTRSTKPFFLILAWGPPHDPYGTAPAEYRAMYDPAKLILRPNVPPGAQLAARTDLAGYYAHCSALDHCIGELRQALVDAKLDRNTLIVFTADHGDMLWSQAQKHKQMPWDESIRVPMLFHCPALLGEQGRRLDGLISSEDLMPTLLGLCGVAIPPSVEGLDYSRYLLGGPNPNPDNAALITCPAPFGQWSRTVGGREFRGVRTARYTFVRDLKGPWLLYDDQADPYQNVNLCNNPAAAQIQAALDTLLQARLKATKDEFLPGPRYVEKWGYTVDSSGTAPYTP